MPALTDVLRRGGGRQLHSHRLLFAAVAVAWLVVDQLTKSWAESALRTDDIDLFWTLRVKLAHNTGASFGIGGDYGSWIALVAIVVVGLLVWQGSSTQSRLGAVALGMVVGGAVGNVVDRALRGDDGFMSGAVVDFIDLQWWPIFNVADIGIVCGGVLLVASVLFGGGDEPEEGSSGDGRAPLPESGAPGGPSGGAAG